MVSSRDRNLSMWPNPAHYAIALHEPLQDITNITLQSASVPLVAFEVNSGNNRLTFRVIEEEEGEHEEEDILAVIPHGTYTGEEMAVALQTVMNESYAKKKQLQQQLQQQQQQQQIITVTYIRHCDAYAFSSSKLFKLIFSGGPKVYGPQEYDEFSRETFSGGNI